MVFIKDVSGNADAGTASRWGGNDINYIDDYFDDVDITPKIAKINTRTYFRSGKFEWRNPANTFSYIVVGGAITANRNINLPVLSADDTPAFLGLAQTYTAAQTISTSSSQSFFIHRSTSSVDFGPTITFSALDSGAATQEYGRIRFEVLDNTAGSEDGRFKVQLTKGGVVEYVPFLCESPGVTWILGDSTVTTPLVINRDINTNTSTVGVDFNLKDSAGNVQTYSNIRSEIVTNTDGAENGSLSFYCIREGALTNRFSIQSGGEIDLTLDDTENDAISIYKPINTVDSTWGDYNFNAYDSNNNYFTYADLKARIKVNTDGAENAEFEIHTAVAGTKSIRFRVNNLGHCAGDITTGIATSIMDVLATRSNSICNPYFGLNTNTACLLRQGIYHAIGSTNADGVLSNGCTAIGTVSNFQDTTQGHGQNMATGAVANANAGLRWTTNRFRREWGNYMILRVSFSSTSDIRVFIGWSSDSAEIAGETTLNNFSGAGIGKRTGDTAWHTMVNDGDATEDRVATGVTFATTITTIELALDSTSFRGKIGSTSFTAVTTELPAATTMLYPHVEIETGAGAADKTITILPIYVQTGGVIPL